MKYAILLVMLLLIASKATATSTIRNELTICPTNRMASWDVTLPSEVSACLSVVVVRADSNYTLMKRRNQPPNSQTSIALCLFPQEVRTSYGCTRYPAVLPRVTSKVNSEWETPELPEPELS